MCICTYIYLSIICIYKVDVVITFPCVTLISVDGKTENFDHFIINNDYNILNHVYLHVTLIVFDDSDR